MIIRSNVTASSEVNTPAPSRAVLMTPSWMISPESVTFITTATFSMLIRG